MRRFGQVTFEFRFTFSHLHLSTIYAEIWILGFELKMFGSQKLEVYVQLQLLAFAFRDSRGIKCLIFVGLPQILSGILSSLFFIFFVNT